MLKIKFVSGMSCSGKSYYIAKNKVPDDIVVDVLTFQHQTSTLKAEYLFYSEIERLLHRQKNGTIWVETPFYKHYRRKAVISFFKTLAEGFGIDVEWHLIYLQPNKVQYIENYRSRFPNKSTNSSIVYENELEDIEIPTPDETSDGWNVVERIVS